ncbi:DUF86 domain-containing protein [Flavobacterium sp. MFBS3-15]|uniref:HepT-like ribonuclease domain-containing protein n=1 Tax=Flavobacterium sp. MFBS3-15 TaxID=2989816 RepID=UPI0022358DEB|nr:DUF86 domain-containing protein [Flavobacterium sp. MFBS3-15]MCW4468490.1 DUF86 domain-containing protein [Flavobacterium sp. MFBS3-15]
MRSKPGDNARLQHIHDAIREIENYVKAITFEHFSDNSMMLFACIKQLEIIGEASNHLSDNIKGQYESVEWRQIIGLRNIFVHEYFGIDKHIVWDVIQNDLPHFRHSIELIIEELNKQI